MKDSFIVGIDTSNYTTSLAACDRQGHVFFDKRVMLQVKKGEKGLRQSDAFFQHIQNLPGLVTALRAVTHGRFPAAVAVSDRPRPVDGSYMPVFTAGVNVGAVMALTAEAPLYTFSHQEGHIEAAQYGLWPGRDAAQQQPEHFLAFHLSGGTTELLQAERKAAGYQVQIIGGSRDLAAGQLIDRVGVALGLPFPCGRALDELAAARRQASQELPAALKLSDIHLEGAWMNLSGIETQCRRLIQSFAAARSEKSGGSGLKDIAAASGSDLTDSAAAGDSALTDSAAEDAGLADSAFAADIAFLVFTRLKAALEAAVRSAQKTTGIQEVLLVGGVSESHFMALTEAFSFGGASRAFGRYGADNAVGTALLGLRQFQS